MLFCFSCVSHPSIVGCSCPPSTALCFASPDRAYVASSSRPELIACLDACSSFTYSSSIKVAFPLPSLPFLSSPPLCIIRYIPDSFSLRLELRPASLRFLLDSLHPIPYPTLPSKIRSGGGIPDGRPTLALLYSSESFTPRSINKRATATTPVQEAAPSEATLARRIELQPVAVPAQLYALDVLSRSDTSKRR